MFDFLTRFVHQRPAARAGVSFGIRVLFVQILFALAVNADAPQQPVGLILSPGGSKLMRLNTETPLAARAGDLLFTGDTLKTENSPASFLFCPATILATLGPSGEVQFEATQTKVKAGKLSPQPARSCTLPTALRVAVATQQHYGVTMTRGSLDSPSTPPVPREKFPPEVTSALAPFDAALAADRKDPAALLGMFQVFEKYNLLANALEVCGKLREQWPDAVWLKSKIFDLQQLLATKAADAGAAAAANGATFALLIGVSKYKNPELSLQFANADASDFGKLVESPRGGGVPPQNVMLLTDEKATLAQVRLGFQDFLKRRAGKNDTVIILVASHGTVDVPGSKGAYILTYDSDPQDLKSTALPMAELRALFEEQLSKVGRVVIFVDVCKASTIGSIRSASVNSDVQHLQDAEGQLLGLMASRAREVSFEGPQFGTGHGAFSYFVTKGMAGAADENSDGSIDGNELIRYVVTQVPKATGDKQHPTDISNSDVGNFKLADLNKPGIQITRQQKVFDYETREPLYLASLDAQIAFAQEPVQDLDRFNSAIDNGRILPRQPENAFAALAKLKTELPPQRYAEMASRLEVALEDKAQEVLLKYLAGDERPQSREDFAAAARYTEAARNITSESLLLEARENFFRGRMLLFDRKYAQATPLLEQAVRLDPGAAYGYNALGIAYLEQAQFEKAIPAFRDAAQRAQHWSYPLHNEALSLMETGESREAIRAYQQAIRLTPQFSYLPYNLGLLYQRLNRRKEAETEYLKARRLSPKSPDPDNALGSLFASENKRGQAEKLFRQALQKNPDFLPARHNLALLIANQKGREQEAVDLWRANLRQEPDYIASRLSLGGFLASHDRVVDAISEYRAVVELRPEYVAARLSLSDLLARSGDQENALSELRQAAALNAMNADIFERIGDVEAGRRGYVAATRAYQQALTKSEPAQRKRIERKLKSIKNVR